MDKTKVIKQLDGLALDCVAILKSHDMLNKLDAGKDIGDSPLAAWVKGLYDMINNMDILYKSSPSALILKHAAMLKAQIREMSTRYEILSEVKDTLDNPLTTLSLIGIARYFSEFDYDDEESSEVMEEEFTTWLEKLVNNKGEDTNWKF